MVIVAELMGNYTHNLDQKNRLAIPAKLREELGECFVLYIPQNGDRCLFGYSLEDWKVLMDKLNDQPVTRRLTREQRFVHLNSDRVEVDKQGRFTIPPRFMEHAGFEHEVFILGAGKRVEFWEPSRWAEMEQAYLEEDDDHTFDLAY